MTINKHQIIIGMLTLFVGSLVYIFDRPPESALFISFFNISLFGNSTVFGSIGNYLPSFTHVVAFILITAGVLNVSKKYFLAVCCFWLTLDILFELGQKFKEPAIALTGWLPYAKGYFLTGTFSVGDVTAFLLGTVLAYVILMLTNKGSGPSEMRK